MSSNNQEQIGLLKSQLNDQMTINEEHKGTIKDLNGQIEMLQFQDFDGNNS